tara:strand:- start:535 stop:1515 length:981 start_codon:yes stop_codon:yes gene_type:complete
MKNPKIFIGPMSKNIVDAVIEYANENSINVGLIPSRRQVEFDGGYVNNWTTKEFFNYVKSKTDGVLLVRDHGGPNQGNKEDDGLVSLKEDCKYFDVIHIDVWKQYHDLHSGIEKTVELIKYCYGLNPNLLFEIGTEQSIRPFTSNDLDYLLQEVKIKLPYNILSQIKYAVIQSGTALEGNMNIGEYDKTKLESMVNVVKKHGLTSKEHNGDYLPPKLIEEKFKLGLNSINIAPEFGQIETKIILDKMKELSPELIDRFYQVCFDSKKWVKWVSPDYKPEENKEEIINISGHYVFSNEDIIKLKSKLGISDDEIKKKIKNKLDDISF